MTQLEFPAIREQFGAVPPVLRHRARPRTTVIDYTLRRAAALHVLNVTHSLYNVMAAVAKAQAGPHGGATVPGVCSALAVTFQNVDLHLRRNADLFVEDSACKPRRYRLSREGLNLMLKIKQRTDRHE